MVQGDKEYLLKVADALDSADRLSIGGDEQEGSKVIQMSDELARELANQFRRVAESIN